MEDSMIKSRSLTILNWLIIPFALLTFPVTSTAIDATVSAEFNSAYVYHGITYNDGPVVQPSLDLTKGFFGFNLWANYDISDYNGTLNSHQFSEIDMTPYIFTTYNGTELSLSLAEYSYPNVSTEDGGALAGNREIIAAAKHSIYGPLSAEVRVQYEIKEVKDYYSRLTMFYVLPEVTSNLTVNIAASVAYVGDDTAILSSGGTEGGFHEYNVKGLVTYTVNKTVKIGANIGYTDSMDKNVLPYTDVNLYGGLSIQKSL